MQDALEAGITLSATEKNSNNQSQRKATTIKNIKSILLKVTNWEIFSYYVPSPADSLKHFSTNPLEKELTGCLTRSTELCQKLSEAQTILSKAQASAPKRALVITEDSNTDTPPQKQTFRDMLAAPRQVLHGSRRNRTTSTTSNFSMFSNTSRVNFYHKKR